MDITKKIIKLVKNTDDYSKWKEYVEDRAYNDIRYYMDNTKLKNLGWVIVKKFDEELKKICES